MEKYNLWFDGISAETLGIRLTGPMQISAPEPKVTTYTVPGRNGDLHIYDGSYKNRTATVEAYVYSPDMVKRAFGRINEWLFNSFGYRKLVTDDDREHYMLARVVNGAEIAARIRKIAPFQLKFDCKPQRFLFAGEEVTALIPDVLGREIKIHNPTAFPAKPICRVDGLDLSHTHVDPTYKGTLTVGDYELEVTGLGYSEDPWGNFKNYIHYDAEAEYAYHDSENVNDKVYAPKGLSINGGDQVVTMTGDIARVEFIPRWWEL